MHHLDLGLFNYQVIYTRVLLKELCGQIAVDELDNRLAKIPRFSGLKIFKNGLENIKLFTANEFLNMMKEYGAINGFTTETYEFLHKEAVKIPYRSSNKRDPTDQMIKSVYRKGIIKYLLQRTNVNRRKQKTLMNSLLGTFNLQDFDAFFNNYRSNNSLAREALTALEYFLESLNEFLDLCEGLTDNETINISCLLGTFNLQDFDAFFNNYRSNNSLAREALTALEYFLELLNEFLDLCEGLTDNETINISWYSYANISSSGDYIRAKSLYYNEPSFSDVSISMSKEESEDYNTAEGGACFGKVLMLINVKIIEKDLSFDLALVQWYDFCNSRQLYKYDCPWLKIINTYNFVPIESIIELVQVVQRAERQNEYFVNTFMF
ncbi:hypothetical protein GLOIN_2v1836852 [Rhizophagus irregularis DAOM 181602=DAOM 197198]|uniref:Uncharacterized protein n=1 Tax=Rhizophagus irregularis (strain DAOM 181602 / DAOM 197198 / MUCL 43194) TaxID=747089 RepID=A0A2P4QLB0_RHIID|nr:hypothetical protein GLOIN_2v1836852 [Rhizophagus irregularis DAOM 181602=DAOM 197198]POG78431.1 hypothetical protein GLOIN_2v1836852 [Rhizophagus irregularis DAOM 181602=DAOM 197198]|eukprot:XP_025185297.1 hypothetical protein GLOIN_2v1836852 [Rhizophagus irregularis DAOM 181602=DAOM 197198]